MKIDNDKEPDSIPELMKKSGEMSVGRRSWRGIIPIPRRGLHRHFCKNNFCKHAVADAARQRRIAACSGLSMVWREFFLRLPDGLAI
ncbi:hypothetical protein LNP26_03045 [Klebsiella variicola subsp. variicola]|nr:hypothetical protein [Klebsiella variicola subsp. variicola]